ncbi:hypothetical protein [Christiangramia sp. LLG6405-1]|uniref:hypothetical protein n=1 Tax=Christiangramia sp. LLG6405-1 TaxID=3160832 RepID=UPI0038664E60
MHQSEKKNYFKGKTIFIISILVITTTFLSAWLNGMSYNRGVTTNLYLSLSIIGAILFLFMTYGLYTGAGLEDNLPKFRSYKKGEFFGDDTPGNFEMPTSDVGDGIAGFLISILLWILMTIAMILLFILLEALFWFTLFILILMLYWIFFRALKLVFSRSGKTVGNIVLSISYSITYTILYLGWIFLIVFLADML